MHAEVEDFVRRAVDELGPFTRTVEFGSLDINGSIRHLFTGDYIGVDREPGPLVDVVADACQWEPDESVDCVVCCEVLEHLAEWPDLLASAARALRPGGVVILTMAGPGRGPHSAVDGNAVRDGEHYANIEPADLALVLRESFTDVFVEQLGFDVRATARRR